MTNRRGADRGRRRSEATCNALMPERHRVRIAILLAIGATLRRAVRALILETLRPSKRRLDRYWIAVRPKFRKAYENRGFRDTVAAIRLLL